MHIAWWICETIGTLYTAMLAYAVNSVAFSWSFLTLSVFVKCVLASLRTAVGLSMTFIEIFIEIIIRASCCIFPLRHFTWKQQLKKYILKGVPNWIIDRRLSFLLVEQCCCPCFCSFLGGLNLKTEKRPGQGGRQERASRWSHAYF